MNKATCSVTGCGARSHARGICLTHYNRLKRSGALPPRKVTTEIERFWAKVDKSGECWEWTGAKGSRGYGSFWLAGGRKTAKAHRYSYELTRGPIPDGMVIDHICRNTSCVNPDHLRVVTQKQNMEHAGVARHNTTGARGVSRVRRGRYAGQYAVTVVHNAHHYHGGFYADLEDAQAAAVALRNRLYTHNDLDRMAG